MSQWLFDLGNTRLKCAPLHADGSRGEAVAIPHRGGDIAQAIGRVLPPRFAVAHLASVADGALRVAVLDALALRCERVSLARTQARFGAVRIAYPEPRQLGVDRFLALLAAHARGGGDVLVCGIGTGLTIDLLDAVGRHHGGLIAPSPVTMREALNDRAPHLPVDGGGAGYDFADNTIDALAAGCDGAALGLIERSLAMGLEKLGRAPVLHLHGGGAEPLSALLPGASWSPDLVLDGLAIWAAAESAP
ncbi:MAG: type III pantothenate kinase [Pseudomonadota bacterium]|nr:type III pantothenate kinase [Pseudomonadota bacterium]